MADIHVALMALINSGKSMQEAIDTLAGDKRYRANLPADTKLYDRKSLDAAKSILEHQARLLNGAAIPDPNYLYSGLAQAALPHKRLCDDATWQVKSENVTLIVRPGLLPNPKDPEKPIAIGVPYGSYARLILIYMQTQAILHQSPKVRFGKSLNGWVSNLQKAKGGTTQAKITDQANRILACSLTFHIAMDDRIGLMNENIVKSAFIDDRFTAELSPAYYEQLLRHALPLNMQAIDELSNNSSALDAYAWLAYRLHVLENPLFVSWAALKGQFGQGYKESEHALNNFRIKFRETLNLANAVYPEAKLEMTPKGVTLFPSKPPVEHTSVRLPKAQKALAAPGQKAKAATKAALDSDKGQTSLTLG